MSAAALAQQLRAGAVPGLENSKAMPSEDFRDGWERGMTEGEKFGYERGLRNAGWKTAQEMRVLFCALITAHKRRDESAFWATVEIAKQNLSQHANFNAEDWALFRRDAPREESP
jgi:hypothetical protein